ncbi:MAG TPA: hypothetical protein VFT90_11630 [Chryseosolibacter sp.]|nr:hypothetical protein [Chryseosolibacter sp.]
MARQESVILLAGGIGNLTFYKSVDGYLARKKSYVSAERIRSDPAFQRTRENNADFSRAGRAAKLLRNAFRGLLIATADRSVTGNLTREIMKVIQADQINPRGQRNVIDGEPILLEGFDFNRQGPLVKTFFAPFTAFINRATGTMVLDIPTFSIESGMQVPEGATHVRLKSAGAAIDFERNTYAGAGAESDVLEIGQQVHGPLRLSQSVSPGSPNPLFLVFAVEFMQLVNGVHYPLKSGAFNAMTIVKVDAHSAQ